MNHSDDCALTSGTVKNSPHSLCYLKIVFKCNTSVKHWIILSPLLVMSNCTALSLVPGEPTVCHAHVMSR